MQGDHHVALAPRLTATPRGARALLAACVFVSGAAGLVYEVAWARTLARFVGATAIAHATVLAGFLGGLAVGAALLGRAADRRPDRALRLYAALELVIAGFGVASPALHAAVARAFRAATDGQLPGPALTLEKLAVAAALVAIPAAAMGGTLPVVARATATADALAATTIARLYRLNTTGAAVGVLWAGLIAIPNLGVATAVELAAAANLAAALGALLAHELSARARLALDEEPGSASPPLDDARLAAETKHAATRHTTPPSPRALTVAAGVLGIATLTVEVVWTRVFGMVFGSSSQAFTLMLAAFIGGIALGAAAAERRLSRVRGPVHAASAASWALTAAMVALCIGLPLYERLPYWQFAIANVLERRATAYPVALAAQATLAFAWMLPFTVATGACLPLLVAAAAPSSERVGTTVGRLFAVNTLGNVAGPLVASFVLLPALGLRHTLTAAVALLGVAAIVTNATADRPADHDRVRTRRRLVASVVAALCLGMLAPAWNPSVMHAGGFRRWTFEPDGTFEQFLESRGRSTTVFNHDGPTDSAVVLRAADGHIYLKVNGKTDASDAEDMPTQRLLAHIPLLLHYAATGNQSPTVFVVGLGGGITAGSAALHPNTRVTVAELSEGVLAAAPLFAAVNHDVLSQPNVEVLRGDGREWLDRVDRRFDVVISQPSNPWVAGNAALFTREFFELMHDRLAPGGIAAQWMHVYAMDDASVDSVLETFGAAFPYVTVWWPQGVDVVLLGSDAPLTVDVARLRAALARTVVRDDLQGDPAAPTTASRFLALQLASESGLRATLDGGPRLATDLDPVLEFTAPVAQFVGARSERFANLDERARPGPSDLLWATLPASEIDLADLADFYAARDTPFSDRLAGSLAHAVAGGDVDAAEFADFATRATGGALLFEAWATALQGRRAWRGDAGPVPRAANGRRGVAPP
ncbi:MAG: fused MFS/spermidine synthase [Myxococcales bacterium]|nr:fused MFS/spermidine synthase [Myxococcales bacterium]